MVRNADASTERLVAGDRPKAGQGVAWQESVRARSDVAAHEAVCSCRRVGEEDRVAQARIASNGRKIETMTASKTCRCGPTRAANSERRRTC